MPLWKFSDALHTSAGRAGQGQWERHISDSASKAERKGCLGQEVAQTQTHFRDRVGYVCKRLVQVILSTKEGAKLEGNTLPVSYPKFTSMVQKGDTIFLGRYLVTGSEESSCYLTV